MKSLLPLLALPLLIAGTAIAEPGPNLPLSAWKFVAIDGKSAVSPKAKLRIFEDRIEASVGCNGMGGDLRLESGRMITGPMMSTQMYCNGLMEQERAVADLLSASPSFFAEGGRMFIHSDKHQAELTLAR